MSVRFLSQSEIAHLTGAKTPGRQCRCLASRGIRHFVDDDGWPIVHRDAANDDQIDVRGSGRGRSRLLSSLHI
ncbi:MAG: DUF4224 domain-containing protein [Acidobacteriaceae bacterium]|nr:DUF4224 domain-containing protein [Acidobacteriaceae bacterium]